MWHTHICQTIIDFLISINLLGKTSDLRLLCKYKLALAVHNIFATFYQRNGMEFHGTSLLTWKSSMEFHGTSGEFHGIPWNSMELWNIDINKIHNRGSVFHCLLHDFMSLYIRQSISSWNIEIFQFQSNFLVPLILVKWRYSILNGGLLFIVCH